MAGQPLARSISFQTDIPAIRSGRSLGEVMVDYPQTESEKEQRDKFNDTNVTLVEIYMFPVKERRPRAVILNSSCVSSASSGDQSWRVVANYHIAEKAWVRKLSLL